MEAVLNNLYMPEDAEDSVLVRYRLPEPGHPRCGRAFVGGDRED